MAQMKKRNAQLQEAIGKIPTKKVIEKVMNIPEYDTVNLSGHSAYDLSDALKLIFLLNTSKLQTDYYRSESATITQLKDLIFKIASKDPYFVAQCIVWSRCCGEGLRSINHLAAALLAPFTAGTSWGKRFYSAWNKKERKGGCIYRLDDMSEIKDVFSTLNKTVLTNAMKKGFVQVLEQASAYELAKYKKTTIDISNLVHPNISKSKAFITVDNKNVNVIDELLKGNTISADTWEAQNSEAGQIVAKAVKDGKLSKEKAVKVLQEAKNNNWEGLLNEGKLGILAALRNLRNILEGQRSSVIHKLCELVENGELIRQGKIMPYQFDLAITAVENSNVSNVNQRSLLLPLEKGMMAALPNLKEALQGKTLVMIDCSGSMSCHCRVNSSSINHSCLQKGAILASMLAKGTNADIIVFGSQARRLSYNPNDSFSTISKQIQSLSLGGTDISTAFDLITKEHSEYDRIFLISDNEANSGCLRSSYSKYITQVCDPYVYCIDLAAYGTMPLKSKDKVFYYGGYGYSMFEDISKSEFSAVDHIEKVKQIVI